MSHVAIKMSNLDMTFRLPDRKIDSVKEYLIKRVLNQVKYTDFFALQDINFEIDAGERVGVIGNNGAGKSTLLKLISGVMKPTRGDIMINGIVAPLLELGAGFDQEFSGVENIHLNAAILGRGEKYIKSKLQEIIAFSELGDFIHVPVKNYSSGMRAKLGFSIATIIEPEILILDEILGVGDKNFKIKSSQKIKEIIANGCTVMIASHKLDTLLELTTKTIWLEDGKIVMFGSTDEVCRIYEKR